VSALDAAHLIARLCTEADPDDVLTVGAVLRSSSYPDTIFDVAQAIRKG
jgi:hypothetical protein